MIFIFYNEKILSSYHYKTIIIFYNAVDDNVVISKNIKAIREKLGYTQVSIANYLNISQAAYSKYESNENDIPTSVIEKLAILFGVNEVDFYEENQALQLSNVVFAFRASDMQDGDLQSIARFKKIIRNYIDMSDEIDKRRNRPEEPCQ